MNKGITLVLSLQSSYFVPGLRVDEDRFQPILHSAFKLQLLSLAYFLRWDKSNYCYEVWNYQIGWELASYSKYIHYLT